MTWSALRILRKLRSNQPGQRVEVHGQYLSVGHVFPGVEVRLVGTDAQPVSEGEVGELWVRGPNVMKGYYRAPEETASAINAEGWFNTRDLGLIGGRENFISLAAQSELIVRFGFNVYPAEVEKRCWNSCPWSSPVCRHYWPYGCGRWKRGSRGLCRACSGLVLNIHAASGARRGAPCPVQTTIADRSRFCVAPDTDWESRED